MYLFLDRKGIEAYSNFVVRFLSMTGIMDLFPDRMGIDTFFISTCLSRVPMEYLIYSLTEWELTLFLFQHVIPGYQGNT